MEARVLHEEADGVALSYALVAGSLGGRLLVRCGDAVQPALRAAGCLLAPEMGDMVLVATTASCESYVLSVLARASGAPGTMGLSEGLTVDASPGRLVLHGGQVAIHASSGLELSADEVAICANRTAIRSLSLALSGELLRVVFSRTKTVAGAVERVLGRVVERVARVYRRVDDFEDVKAGRYSMTVQESLRMKSGSMSLEARGSVDVDGDKIRLG